jgi:DNA-binding transcriptional LysR family regulator
LNSTGLRRRPDNPLGGEHAEGEQGRAGHLGGGDVPLPVPAHLTTTPLSRDLADVIVRRDHVLAGRQVVTPRDLVAENWIGTPEGTICRQWLLRMYDGTGRLPRIEHVSLEFDSRLALVTAGLA